MLPLLDEAPEGCVRHVCRRCGRAHFFAVGFFKPEVPRDRHCARCFLLRPEGW